MKKRIFYFNISYACSNKCIFCYSHNTKHIETPYNELSFSEFKRYINSKNVSLNDRIVLNGGEPLLHSEIDKYLHFLSYENYETVIFSNGRLAKKLDSKYLTCNIRFVIPIHGCEHIHDYITGIKGSFQDTLSSIHYLTENMNNCLVDMKIILNEKNIENPVNFLKSLETWNQVTFNNAVHITMMADTKISKANGCVSLNRSTVSSYTNKLIKNFIPQNIVKIYGTCIQGIEFLLNNQVKTYEHDLEFIYKDFSAEKVVELKEPDFSCDNKCIYRKYCKSEVTEYKVLELNNNKIYESVE
ncbi:radical SAM protein [Clostridium butyricum]|jgi:organic radical activating enzyme|uniref:radical SAM protein n=1 Tax=Clostridium butyricum TaxID=1492 RepID=UPI00374F6D34